MNNLSQPGSEMNVNTWNSLSPNQQKKVHYTRVPTTFSRKNFKTNHVQGQVTKSQQVLPKNTQKTETFSSSSTKNNSENNKRNKRLENQVPKKKSLLQSAKDFFKVLSKKSKSSINNINNVENNEGSNNKQKKSKSSNNRNRGA
jgi:hypothetical protein